MTVPPAHELTAGTNPAVAAIGLQSTGGNIARQFMIGSDQPEDPVNLLNSGYGVDWDRQEADDRDADALIQELARGSHRVARAYVPSVAQGLVGAVHGSLLGIAPAVPEKHTITATLDDDAADTLQPTESTAGAPVAASTADAAAPVPQWFQSLWQWHRTTDPTTKLNDKHRRTLEAPMNHVHELIMSYPERSRLRTLWTLLRRTRELYVDVDNPTDASTPPCALTGRTDGVQCQFTLALAPSYREARRGAPPTTRLPVVVAQDHERLLRVLYIAANYRELVGRRARAVGSGDGSDAAMALAYYEWLHVQRFLDPVLVRHGG